MKPKALAVMAALLIGGCTAALATVDLLVPTLDVVNLTEDQLNVGAEDRGTIGRVPPMGRACIVLRNLAPGEAVLSFRAISSMPMRAMPQDYATAGGWTLTITHATHDGGFFASPGARCR